MATHLIDLRQARNAASDNLADLQAYLTQLVGEPFRFARVSYGDELTLHFGDHRPARSPKLRNKPYGSYILGVRGSPWLLKSGSEPLVLTADLDGENLPNGLGKPIRKEELEANPLISAESRVLTAMPFVVKPINGFGLQLRLSDGSSLLILPTLAEAEIEKSTPEIALADWDLTSPQGLLSAGPGPNWSFKPSTA
ncbi:MAG: hypothetical protein ACRELF_12615 [Gemmataceae bacterium]